MNSKMLQRAFVCSLLALSLGEYSCQAQQKITLTPSMVFNESAREDAGLLVDEQELSGDVLGSKGGQPKTIWTAGWTAWFYPIQAFIDLGAKHKISQIFLYDGAGAGDVKISAGQPFSWQPLFTDGLKSYMAWNRHDVDVSTRYVRVEMMGPVLNMPEIVLYGTPQEKAVALKPTAAKPQVMPRTPIDQLIGINAFIDDPLDKMQVAGFVREYHNWMWDEGDSDGKHSPYPNNLKSWNPSVGAGGAWNFDDYYTKLKNAGITVAPCLQNTPLWMAGGDYGKTDHKPIFGGKDAEDPAAYAVHADHMFQFAARYGNTKVADNKLKLTANQKRVSGLNLLTYFENWNEPDKWWEGRDAYFSPYELAAMGSADRDGHMGKMGATFGIKNADSKAKLVLGGLASLNLDYLKSMKLWSDFNRGGEFPYDVINLHHYSNNGGGQQKGRIGISPEDDKLKDKLQAIVEWRDRNVPTAEVWLTEFGYDTHQGSPQRAPSIAQYSPEEVQAQWLVRSYLALAAAGIDRAAMYMLRDVDPTSPGQFSTCGLVTQKGEWKPKPSWYYVYTLKNRLAGMRFVREVPTGDKRVLAYEFADAKTRAFAVWCPTSDGTKIQNFKFKVHNAKSATLVQLNTGETNGAASSLNLKNGEATIDVSERPVLIKVS